MRKRIVATKLNTDSETGNSALPKRSQIIAYVIGALLIFTLGHLIFHGREARLAGTWNSIVTSSDEFFYWAAAKGASQAPISDENPYYYEEIGRRMPLPWTTAIFFGQLAKIIHAPVMILFPIWHIGMPFLLWLSLFLCLWKIWRYPAPASAAFSMALLLSTLFLRGQMQFVLFRFSRPGDGLWLLFILISLLMKPLNRPRDQITILSLGTFSAFWLQPFYVSIAVVIVLFESFWKIGKEKSRTYLYSTAAFSGSLLAAAVTYLIYFNIYRHPDSWLVKDMTEEIANQTSRFHWPSAGIFGLVSALAAANWFFKKSLSPVARLTLYSFLMEPLLAGASSLFPCFTVVREFSIHRYYFFFIQTAALTGWFAEILPAFFESRIFKKWEPVFVAAPVAILFLLLINRETYFLRYATFIDLLDDYMIYMDNAFLLAAVLSLLLIMFWLYNRFGIFRAALATKKAVAAFLFVAAVCGYLFLPCHHSQWNRKNPFEGAYQWFRGHAEKNEVVLTVPPNRIAFDYLILNTDLKTYYTETYGANISGSPANIAYRREFYQLLLLDWLKEVPLGGYGDMRAKLKHFRLDYILINVPSPFRQAVEGQLAGYLRKVYEDKRALIWKVVV